MVRFALIVVFFSCASFSATKRFDFRDVGGRNLVTFTSDALLEKIVGLSNSVSGWVEIDPDKVGDVRGEILLDVRTFQTGIEARNEQIREKVQSETPIAIFTIEKISNASKKALADGDVVTLRAQGNLQLRGVTKPQSALVKIAYLKETDTTRKRLTGNLLKVSATLDLDTAEFQINIPATQAPFFSRYLQVSADLIGSDSVPGPSLGFEPPRTTRETSSTPKK